MRIPNEIFWLVVFMTDTSSLTVGLVNLNQDLKSTILSVLAFEPRFKIFNIDLDSLEIPISKDTKHPRVIVLGEGESKEETCRLLRFVKKMFSSPSILLVIFNSEPFPLSDVFRNGGNGCLCMEALTNNLPLALAAVGEGRLYVEVCESEHTWDFEKIAVEDQKLIMTAEPQDVLSAMERTVLLLVAKGQTNQQIADQLPLSKKTVEKYRSQIKEKLGIEKRNDLVQYALDHNMFGLH